jgi:hypothetical protein
MPERIDLGEDGEWAEIRTEFTGGDQKWYLILRDKLARENGTAKPGQSMPDPANPAVMLNIPPTPAELLPADNMDLLDGVLARFLTSWSLAPALPWSSAMRDVMDLDNVVLPLDGAALKVSRHLLGLGPKPTKSTPTSAGTSSGSAPASPAEDTPRT